MFGLPNPLDVVSKAANAVSDIVQDGAKLAGPAALAGLVGTGPLGLIAGGLLQNSPILDGILDKLPKLPSFPFPGVTPAPTQPKGGDSAYQGMLDSVKGLGGEIEDLKKQLENKNLTPEQRMELSFKMQEKMQERSQMISMLTNMMKTEHDSVKELARNFAV